MSIEESDNKLEMSLLDNGLDFILKGIDEIFDDDYIIYEIDSVWTRILSERRKQFDQSIKDKAEKFKISRDQFLKDLEREFYDNKGADFSFTICPDCYQNTLLTHGEFEGICTNPECGGGFSLTNCLRCNAVIPGYPWEQKFCDYCSEWIQKQ